VILQSAPKSRKYRWFRFVVTENAYSCARYDTEYSVGKYDDGTPKPISAVEAGYVQIMKLSFYDKDGNDLVEGFRQKTPITQFAFEGGDARVMEPGEVALGRLNSYARFTDPSQLLQNLFYRKSAGHYPAVGGLSNCDGGIRQDDPETWLPIVVRLPDDAPEAVRFDFACARKPYGDLANAGSYNHRNITAFRLDASADGINWDVGIAANSAIEVPEEFPRWDSEPDKSMEYGVRKDKGTKLSSTEVSGFEPANVYSFSSIGAANGATVKVEGTPVEISGLRVDALAEAGNIENFNLAANGTLEVLNLDENTKNAVLPVNVAGLSESGIGNWKVNINGKPSNWKCTVTKDGKIRITPAGVYLIVR
jgi:hypothetical protein